MEPQRRLHRIKPYRVNHFSCDVMTWNPFPQYWPFWGKSACNWWIPPPPPPERTNNAELWWNWKRCWTNNRVAAVWDAMMLMWRPCNAIEKSLLVQWLDRMTRPPPPSYTSTHTQTHTHTHSTPTALHPPITSNRILQSNFCHTDAKRWGKTSHGILSIWHVMSVECMATYK